jgi:D-alanine--poly(phosphoribitol) ligase subunit 1
LELLDRIFSWSRSHPARLAHVSGPDTLSYGELDRRSDAVAAHLLEHLPEDRSPVAVEGHKEPELVVAFLGCVKAGHPYVPLDDAMPRQRIDTIVEASGARYRLTPDIVRHVSGRPPTAVSVRSMDANDTFYIIFTSGSTGMPKGVPITLGCLMDFLGWMEGEQRFGANEVFLNQVPFSFDVSILDLYLTLLTGATMFSITRNHIAAPAALYQALHASGVTVWTSTPSFVHLCLAERSFNADMLPRLERFFLAGEALSPAMVGQLLDRFPSASVWNMYGPTEATVVTTSVRLDRSMLQRYSSVPIGFPKRGTRVDVLDDQNRRVPPGARGEIVIAGPNVSPGYLNRPDATERAFFLLDGVHAYRTGDAGHVEDGLVFFDGRLDNQIKLHGYRIELGDVEAHLAAVEGVRDAVVLPLIRKGKIEALQAFVVLSEAPAGTDVETANALRSRLAQRLPAYMLPRTFRFLEAFPLTVNGKADRRALAALA